MVSPQTAMSLVSLAVQLSHAKGEESNGTGGTNGTATQPASQSATAESQQATRDAVQELLAHERVSSPSPTDRDAFASATLELNDGDTAEVTISPLDGYTLRVAEVAFDRKTNHEYTLNVAGEVNSVSHQARYSKPKRVSQSDRVVATVTNNSGSTSVIDFEMKAWAERGNST